MKDLAYGLLVVLSAALILAAPFIAGGTSPRYKPNTERANCWEFACECGQRLVPCNQVVPERTTRSDR